MPPQDDPSLASLEGSSWPTPARSLVFDVCTEFLSHTTSEPARLDPSPRVCYVIPAARFQNHANVRLTRFQNANPSATSAPTLAPNVKSACGPRSLHMRPMFQTRLCGSIEGLRDRRRLSSFKKFDVTCQCQCPPSDMLTGLVHEDTAGTAAERPCGLQNRPTQECRWPCLERARRANEVSETCDGGA
jgi:hypothetical protein